MNEIKAFNIKIHPLHRSEFLSIIEKNLQDKIKTIQNGVNASSITELFKDVNFKNAIINSDLINIDGISVVWALRLLGFKVPERVACPDIVTDLLSLAETKNYRIFLLGARESNLLLTVQNLKNNHRDLIIAGYRDGYFQQEDEPSVVQLINDSKPDILFLGLPSPKKELFAEKYKNELTAKYIFGIGGLFDILSGNKKRAPKWLQKIGMEWFYRFIQEPKRMWRRYLIGNTEFIWLVLKEKFKNMK
jgi:N-acetylglucosaminyldiphosphoundecaprenol N-acetyl-beta-D-mannosaminyltransferase